MNIIFCICFNPTHWTLKLLYQPVQFSSEKVTLTLCSSKYNARKKGTAWVASGKIGEKMKKVAMDTETQTPSSVTLKMENLVKSKKQRSEPARMTDR